MRKMKSAETENFIKEFGWATLCMAEKDGSPYAIEFSYFLDNNDICGLVHSTGRASRVLTENNRICLKICDSDRHCENFTAVSCFGTASFERLSDRKKIAWPGTLWNVSSEPRANMTPTKKISGRQKNSAPAPDQSTGNDRRNEQAAPGQWR